MGVCSPTCSSCRRACRRRRSPSSWRWPSRQPGKLTYGSSGIGGAGHLAGELFKQRAGIDMVHAPYKGGGPAMTDLLGGRIEMYVGVPSTVAAAHRRRQGCARSRRRARARRNAAQRAHRRRVGLSRLRGNQLVRVRGAREDAEGDPRLLEPRDRQGARRSAREGRARAATGSIRCPARATSLRNTSTARP